MNLLYPTIKAQQKWSGENLTNLTGGTAPAYVVCCLYLCNTIDMYVDVVFYIIVTRTNHVCITNEMHFVTPYHRYIHILFKTQ